MKTMKRCPEKTRDLKNYFDRDEEHLVPLMINVTLTKNTSSLILTLYKEIFCNTLTTKSWRIVKMKIQTDFLYKTHICNYTHKLSLYMKNYLCLAHFLFSECIISTNNFTIYNALKISQEYDNKQSLYIRYINWNIAFILEFQSQLTIMIRMT